MPEHQKMQQSGKPDSTFQKQAILTSQTHVSHPASIIQRARINPKSLTAADVLQLQRTIGNRAVGKLLSEIRNPSKVQQVPIQLQEIPKEEKEPLQGMFGKKPEEEACPSCMQKQKIPEEEEPLQGKFETIQRLEPEDEEKLQMKSVVQRQEIPEEEESLQGKMTDPVQRQEIPEEEEPIQGKMIGTVQRQEIPEEEEPLQKKSENNTGMPDNLKAGVENLSGINMSDVRVHYNSDKPAQVGALAYTQGTNIHVAPGQERHLPHEAWHVVQQAQGRVRPTMQMKDMAVNDDVGLEHEADVMGAKTLRMTRSDQVMACSKPQISTLLQRRKIAASPFPVDFHPLVQPQEIKIAGNHHVSQIEALHEIVNNSPVIQRTPVIQRRPFDYVTQGVVFNEGAAQTADNLGTFHPPFDHAAPGTNAYVATVPTTSQGKDKPATQVADQYVQEGFETQEQAARRFALTVAINRFQSTLGGLINLNGLLADVAIYNHARLGAVAYTWEVQWRDNRGANRTHDEILTDLLNQPDIDKPGWSDGIEAAEQAEKTHLLERGVPNEARNMAANAIHTQRAVSDFTNLGYNVKIHIGDSDAVTLRAKDDALGAGADAATGIFDRADAAYGANAGARLLSGGYLFYPESADAVGTNDPQDGVLPRVVPPRAGAAGMAHKQTVVTNELDMKVREALLRAGDSPYLPEPNIFVNADLLYDTSKAPGAAGFNRYAQPFGAGGSEWPRLLHNLRLTANEVAFDNSVTLYTDAGRFDEAYTGQGGAGVTPYGRDKTTPKALFDPARAKQSHAKASAITSDAVRTAGLERADKVHVGKLLKAFLPQELFGISSAVDDDASSVALTRAKARTGPAAAGPSLLDSHRAAIGQLKLYITHFASRKIIPTLQRVGIDLQNGTAIGAFNLSLVGPEERNVLAGSVEVKNAILQAIQSAIQLHAQMVVVLNIGEAAGGAISDYLRNFNPTDPH